MLIAVKVLAFWKLRPRRWGTNTSLVPQPKSWGTSLPRSLRLLRLWKTLSTSLFLNILLQMMPARRKALNACWRGWDYNYDEEVQCSWYSFR